MLNILLVYYEPAPAGQTTHVLSLVRGLDGSRYCFTVVLPAGLQRALDTFRQTGVDLVPLPMRKVLWRSRAILSLARLIRRQRFDVVHVHSQEAGLMGRAICWMAGARRVVYTPQTLDIRRARWRRLYVWVERALARITDVIVSVSEVDRQRLIEWGIPAQKVVSIPNGVDLSLFDEALDRQRLRRALGLDEHEPVVMQVGRLDAQKAPLEFVEGAAYVLQEAPSAQFVLVGKGVQQDLVAARVQELGLEGRIHLLGWREDARRLMATADVVTLTSHWEGAPYALLEAMAWAKPVVATAVNGCREIVAHGVTGLLVAPGDVTAWAKAVIRLINEPETAAGMGRRSRRRVEERFSLPQVVAQVEALYERCASRTVSAPGSREARRGG